MTAKDFENLKNSLKITIPRLHQEIRDLNAEEKKLKNSIKSKKSEITRQKKDIQKMESKLQELREKEGKFDTIRTDINVKIDNLKADIPQTKEKIKQIEKQYNTTVSQNLEYDGERVHESMIFEVFMKKAKADLGNIYSRFCPSIILFSIIGFSVSLPLESRISESLDLESSTFYIISGMLSGILILFSIIKLLEHSTKVDEHAIRGHKKYKSMIGSIKGSKTRQLNKLKMIDLKVKGLKHELAEYKNEISSIPEHESKINQLENHLKSLESELEGFVDRHIHIREKKIPDSKIILDDEWQSIRHLVPFSGLIKQD